jgi:hypothetical protein
MLQQEPIALQKITQSLSKTDFFSLLRCYFPFLVSTLIHNTAEKKTLLTSKVNIEGLKAKFANLIEALFQIVTGISAGRILQFT